MPLPDLSQHDLEVMAASQDRALVAHLMDAYRERLEQIVALRMDQRLQGRVDPADIVQESIVSALGKFDAYVAKNDGLPFLLWLRLEALQRLVDVHRLHLGTQKRDAGREISLSHHFPSISSLSLAAQFIDRLSTASKMIMHTELKQQIETAINGLSELDREMLALRHFEELTNAEAAQILGLSPTAAYNRYARALRRLRDVLDQLPGGIEGLLR